MEIILVKFLIAYVHKIHHITNLQNNVYANKVTRLITENAYVLVKLEVLEIISENVYYVRLYVVIKIRKKLSIIKINAHLVKNFSTISAEIYVKMETFEMLKEIVYHVQ